MNTERCCTSADVENPFYSSLYRPLVALPTTLCSTGSNVGIGHRWRLTNLNRDSGTPSSGKPLLGGEIRLRRASGYPKDNVTALNTDTQHRDSRFGLPLRLGGDT